MKAETKKLERISICILIFTVVMWIFIIFLSLENISENYPINKAKQELELQTLEVKTNKIRDLKNQKIRVSHKEMLLDSLILIYHNKIKSLNSN